jgi:hypothetical protein
MQKKKIALVASTGIAGLVAGGVLMTGLSANAADGSGTATGTSYGAPSYDAPSSGAPSSGAQPGTAPQGRPSNPNAGDPSKPQRSDEKLLTGTTLAKVTAAVKAKYPDATIQRVETDSDGVYEAHLLVDGKPVTVEVDKSYSITGTEAAPTGQPGGQAPAA